MLKTQRYFFTFLFIYIFTFSFVLADDYEIKIESGTNKFKDLVFSVQPGTQHTGELAVRNDGDKDIDIVLFVAPEEDTSLVDAMKAKEGDDLFINTLFYSDNPPEKYQELLKKNGGDITILCEKKEEENDKALDKWCEGDRSTTITIKTGESMRVPFTVKFSSVVKEHNAYITAVLEDKHDDKVLSQKELTYKIPNAVNQNKNGKSGKIELKSLEVNRSFSLINIFSWVKSGMREKYSAYFFVSNSGSLEENYKIFIKTKHGDKENFYEADASTSANETNFNSLEIPMPWFGKVEFSGGVKFKKNGKVQEFASEKIECLIVPVREIIAILFVMSLFLLFMWRRRNNLNNAIDGNYWIKYKVKKDDNLMSLAYRYGISWKELVYRNKIKAPYTLISGNVIMVPPRPKKVFKNTFMQNKNNLDNLMDDREVHKKSFSNGIKVNVKGDNFEPATQAPVQSQSEKKVINGIYVKQPIVRESVNSSLVQKRDNYRHERMQRTDIVNDRQQHSNKRRSIKNIDINWMHEDDETFDEAMQDEVRAINLKIKMFVLVIIVFSGLVVWWFFNYGIVDDSSRGTASINDLLNVSDEEDSDGDQNNSIESGQQGEKDGVSDGNGDDRNGDDVNNDIQEGEGNSDNIKESANISVNDSIKEPSEVSVQVLNGGAKSGVAGDLTNILKNKLYQTKSATNANNNVDGVVVYYKSVFKKEAGVLSELVPQVYGAAQLEESDDVAKKYGVDIVVVVGK